MSFMSVTMARLSFGVQCTRTLFAILNILFVISGFLLLVFGSYLNVREKLNIRLLQFLDTNFVRGNALRNIGQVLIVFALFTILLSGFGCLGMFKRGR
jgi:hypothetical protein